MIYVGCAGYSYDEWKGVFYPKGAVKSEYLQHYAKYFNFTEIDATFYNVPSQEIVKHWDNHTPADFRFAIKVWKEITHKMDPETIDDQVTFFFNRMHILDQKVSAYLLQFSPRFKYSEDHIKKILYLIEILPPKRKYFLELREDNWFNAKMIDKLKKFPNIGFGTTYLDGVQVFYPEVQSQYYIRLIKDRSLEHFSQQQRKEIDTMNELTTKVKALMRTASIEEIFVIFNNHFRGFSPQDVNEFKQLLGLPFKKFTNSKTLLDFMP